MAHFSPIATKVAARIESALGVRKFALWFGGNEGFVFETETATLRVDAPHQAAADWIAKHYQQELAAALLAEVGGKATFAVVAKTAASPMSQVKQPQALGALVAVPKVAVPKTAVVEAATKTPEAWSLRHRLEAFVVGPANALAYAAAERMSEAQGAGQDDAHDGYQTLFVHGGCGLGKTHLLQGVCRRFLDNNPSASVIYVTGEQFTNAYIEATRHNAFEAFRKKYRSADLLAIDDAHFISANKKQTQQEFLHTLKACLQHNTKIVLASDSAPRQISVFSEQLISLCVSGMVVEVRQPEATTRRLMLEQLGRRRGLSFQPLALDALVAMHSAHNLSVREIEGTLTRLHALSNLYRKSDGALEQVGMGLVRQLEQTESAPKTVRPPKFEMILNVCCGKLGAAPTQVKGRSKHRLVTLARAASVFLAREMTAMSYPEIAMCLGRDSHSTVITAHQRLQKQQEDILLVPSLPADMKVSALLEELRREIRQLA